MFDKLIKECEIGNVEKVASLLLIVDPSVQDNLALLEACYYGNFEIVRLLLADPRVDPRAAGNWPVQISSKEGYFEIVRLLLDDRRVDPTADDNLALKWAISNGHTDVVQLLTQHQFRLDGPEYNRNIL